MLTQILQQENVVILMGQIWIVTRMLNVTILQILYGLIATGMNTNVMEKVKMI